MLKLFIKFKALKLRGFYVLRKCYKWKTYTNDLEILKHILMFEVIELLLLINDHFVISYPSAPLGDTSHGPLEK